jgi:hypothetical protein
MNESPAFTEVKAALITRFTGKVKLLKNSVIFLDANKGRFAGVNRHGVWMSVNKVNGKHWYHHLSSLTERDFQLDKIRFSETFDLGKEIFNHFKNVE